MKQTTRGMRIRLGKHRSNIQTYEEKISTDNKKNKSGVSTVAKFFFNMQQNVSDLKWCIIEKVYRNDSMQIRNRLLQREVYWIVTLETKSPMV